MCSIVGWSSVSRCIYGCLWPLLPSCFPCVLPWFLVHVPQSCQSGVFLLLSTSSPLGILFMQFETVTSGMRECLPALRDWQRLRTRNQTPGKREIRTATMTHLTYRRPTNDETPQTLRDETRFQYRGEKVVDNLPRRSMVNRFLSW